MINFRQLEGPYGIPIYYQHLPVNSVAVYWLVFVGSADDEAVGEHGIYHWFEHIPSRGTKRYPGGYVDTEAQLVRHGGSAGAETGATYTSYYAHVPKNAWPAALDILTNMLGEPLIRNEDVEAERAVIRQEINEWNSSPEGESLCRLPGILWPKHPLGHDQLGTKESLARMNPRLLTKAHRLGYARSHCVLFVAGDIEESELKDHVARSADCIPGTSAIPRRVASRYGPLPAWNGGQQSSIVTKHNDAIVYLLFPVPPIDKVDDQFARWDFLEYLITAGDLGSPLNRLVREQSQLAYAPEFSCSVYPDGGYWGLVAQTSESPELVLDAFWQVLRSPEIRSPSWYEFVGDGIRGEIAMHDPCPDNFVETAADRLITHSQVWSDREYEQMLLGITRAEMNAFLDALSPDDAQALVFTGTKRS